MELVLRLKRKDGIEETVTCQVGNFGTVKVGPFVVPMKELGAWVRTFGFDEYEIIGNDGQVMDFWDEMVMRAKAGDREAQEFLEAYQEAGERLAEKKPIADDPSV